MKKIPYSHAIEAWHFVGKDRRLRTFGRMAADGSDLTVAPGYVYTEMEGRIYVGENGLHGSRLAATSFHNANGPVACRVLLWGEVAKFEDVIAARHREVLWMVDASPILRAWACWCARNTPIRDGRTTWDLLEDERLRRALQTAELFVDGKATLKRLSSVSKDGLVAVANNEMALERKWAQRRFEPDTDSTFEATADLAGKAVRFATDPDPEFPYDLARMAAARARAAAAQGSRYPDMAIAWKAAMAAQSADLERRLLALRKAALSASGCWSAGSGRR